MGRGSLARLRCHAVLRHLLRLLFLAVLLATLVLAFGALVAAKRCAEGIYTFGRDFARMWSYVGATVIPWVWVNHRRATQGVHASQDDAQNTEISTTRSSFPEALGFAPPRDRVSAARISFAQLRSIVVIAIALIVIFVWGLIEQGLAAADWRFDAVSDTVPALTLTVLRTMPLLNGVSAAAPTLLCMLCVYVWSVGASLWIYLQLDRNTIVSHMSGTLPNKVTFDRALLVRVSTSVLVPLLGVAAAQYPEVANLLYRIVAPFLRALK